MAIKSWANMGFRWKLSLPIAVIAIVIIWTSIANYFLLSSIQRNVKQVMEADMPATQLLLEMDRDLYQVLLAERMLITQEPGHPERRKALKEHRENLDQVETRGAEARRLLKEGEAYDLLERFLQDFRQWRQDTERLVTASELGSVSTGTAQDDFDRVRTPLDQAVEAAQAASQARAEEAQQLISKELMQQVSASSVILLMCLVIAIVIPNLVLRPLRAMLHRFEDMARGSGDLTARLNVTSQDEVGQVSQAFNQFMAKLHQLISETAQLTSELGQAAIELSATAKQTSLRVADQHRSIDMVATAVNEMGAAVHEVAMHTADAAREAKRADDNSGQGRKVLDLASESVRDLAAEVEDTSHVIRQLEQETGSIVSILEQIRTIAEQTNLLALNAAIEAARAGEQGRGFAVVADEVRSLASKTQQATANINDLVTRLNKGVNTAVSAMEAGCGKASQVVVTADQAAVAFAEITAAVTQISDMSLQIASSAEEQSAVVEDINRHLTEISQISEQSAQGAQTTLDSAEQLQVLSDRLTRIVGQFRL